MDKQPKFVSYDKASKTEKKSRNQLKRSPIKIPPNQIHKSAKDYDRNNERDEIEREIESWGNEDE